MSQRILTFAIDLGTSATTASFALFREWRDAEGILHREICGSVLDVKDWPGGHQGPLGGICLPTDLVYDKVSGRLLLWGFLAKQFLDEPFPEIKFPNIQRDQVFIVEHIKLLLPDPDRARISSEASARYREARENMRSMLSKDPYEVFEDFLTKVIEHVVGSAKRKYDNGIHSCQIEFVMAFPSGWHDQIHTMVAAIGARAMDKAVSTHCLLNMKFGIEHVYTESETLCGVKEWLRDTIAEGAISNVLDNLTTNLDQLKEGDLFLPIDIGGGTGCMTLVRLVTKEPLRVDQIGPTQSLEVSGEAVDNMFERWLQSRFTKEDHPGDIQHEKYLICRKFKEMKKECGAPSFGSSTSVISVPNLRANQSKGFENGSTVERCFDPVIDTLLSAIRQTLGKFCDIMAIVFLGEFGGSSHYLRNRLAQSDISGRVKLRYSFSGKLDVVKGAMAERSNTSSSFVRKWRTVKSYGSLVALPYYSGSVAENIFPNPETVGAVPFEHENGTRWLIVIEWAIPKGTIVEKGYSCDIGKDGPRHHTWRYNEQDIGFEDIIVISEEVPPAPQHEGKSYTLWTEAHEQNELIINNQRIDVQQIPFSWKLSMSQKIDSIGRLLGPYGREDLKAYWLPEKKKRDTRRRHLIELHYELLWDITEMQVKVHIRALFPNPTGPLITQLAKERRLCENEKAPTGESRSKALIRDIEIVTAAGIRASAHGADALENEMGRERWMTSGRPSRLRLSQEQAKDHRQPVQGQSSLTTSPTRAPLEHEFHSINYSVPQPHRNTSQPAETSVSNTSKSDGRRRDGCYTCKDRKKKCDCNYNFDEAIGSRSCNECSRHKIICYLTQPEWANDPEQLRGEQLKRKELVKLGKRKAREDSDSSSDPARGRIPPLNPSDSSLH